MYNIITIVFILSHAKLWSNARPREYYIILLMYLSASTINYKLLKRNGRVILFEIFISGNPVKFMVHKTGEFYYLYSKCTRACFGVCDKKNGRWKITHRKMISTPPPPSRKIHIKRTINKRFLVTLVLSKTIKVIKIEKKIRKRWVCYIHFFFHLGVNPRGFLH